MSGDSWVTVPQRISALGYEQGTRQGNDLAWRVGAAVRDAWVEEVGELPTKRLATKTSGHGSHCMASYPTSWAPRIDSMISAMAEVQQRYERAQLQFWPRSEP